MRIGIDARTLNVKGGSRTYAFNLLMNISKEKQKDFILFGIDKFENYHCVPEKTEQQTPLFRLYYDLFKLKSLIKKYNISVFHGLKGILPNGSDVKKIVTVHDVSVFNLPRFYNLKNLIYWKYFSSNSIKNADKIISVSNSTKKDLIEKLGIQEHKIKVIYESYNHKLYNIRDGAYKRVREYLLKNNKLDINNKKIILNVNTISPRKNIIGLIKAFNKIATMEKNCILIISGRHGWKTKKIFEEYNKSPFKDRIYFIGFTPDEIVADLYNIAEVFVYPSFYEGFGLPILEAQACGCPVITSNVSSMPEVAGEGAILVNPYNIHELCEVIKNIIKNRSLRNQLVQKGFENCRKFSWKRCAEETLKVYKEVLG